MSRGSRQPHWVPLDAKGASWQLRSLRERNLGLIILMEEQRPWWYAVRQCCGLTRDFTSLGAAASWVLGTLHCEPCAQKRIQRELDRFAS